MKSSNTKNSYILSVRRARGRRRQRRPRRPIPSKRSFKHMVGNSKLSEKLEALKKIIPTQNGETVKSDQLFQETANYIVLLRTRVVILQKLIEFYGSCSESENAALS